MGQYTHSLNSQPISPDFYSAAAAGLVAGVSIQFAVGHVANVTMAGGPIDICEQGTLYPFLATAQQLKVSSSSANDTAAGTGARTVLIQGLDANYLPISETVTLNGLAAVNTVNQYLRINGFGVLTANPAVPGGGTNAGDITLELVAGGSPQGIIRAGVGVSQQAVFTVPAGTLGVLTAAEFSLAGGITLAASQVALTANVLGLSSRVFGVRSDLNSGFPFNETVLVGYPNPPKTDITARMLSTEQDGTELSAAFQLTLFDQHYLTNI